MITYAEGKPYPLSFQGGDVLFIAGRPSTRQIAFEHVVFVAETKTIQSNDEFLDLRVYGLPESEPKQAPFLGLDLSNARRWQKVAKSNRIGSQLTVWNLGGRLDNVDAETSTYILDALSWKTGSVSFDYSPEFNINADLSSPVTNNCLGFVCSVFAYCGFSILHPNFPEYKSPYANYPGKRDFPSPGHLARALRLGDKSHPYYAPTSKEATEFAPALQTLIEFL